MHGHGVCSRTEMGIRWCLYFSAGSCSWAREGHFLEEAVQLLFFRLHFGDGFAPLQFDAVTPTLLRAKASSDTSVPTSDGLRLVFVLIGSSSSSLAQGHSCPEVLAQTCAGMCSLTGLHTRKGKPMFSIQPFIPASLKSLKTHQFQVSKSAP